MSMSTRGLSARLGRVEEAVTGGTAGEVADALALVRAHAAVKIRPEMATDADRELVDRASWVDIQRAHGIAATAARAQGHGGALGAVTSFAIRNAPKQETQTDDDAPIPPPDAPRNRNAGPSKGPARQHRHPARPG